MTVAIGIVVILLALYGMTPSGAAWSMRMNAKPWSGGQGYRPKTITGTRIMSIFVLAIGIAFVVSGA